MKCEICDQGPPNGPTIYRVNKPGEMPARWRCKHCLTAKQQYELDPEVADLVKIIELHTTYKPDGQKSNNTITMPEQHPECTGMHYR